LGREHSTEGEAAVAELSSLLPAPVKKFMSKALSLAGKEKAALEELHAASRATVHRMAEDDPGLQHVLDGAYGYAVFPAVGKATAVVGGAFGKGEVFQRGQLVGYAALVQLTLGVQLGGQTFSEIIAFQDRAALERFKAGRTAFAANASAVLVKAGAATSNDYQSGVMVFVSSEGGMMLEAAIGAQKFIFKPAVLGRAKAAPSPKRKPAKRTTRGARKSSQSRPAARRPARRSAAKSATRRRAGGSGS
jgi:lipid-binding SYLF domain-containing protein